MYIDVIYKYILQWQYMSRILTILVAIVLILATIMGGIVIHMTITTLATFIAPFVIIDRYCGVHIKIYRIVTYIYICICIYTPNACVSVICCPSVYLTIHLSTYPLFICLPVYLSLPLSVRLSVCLSACLPTSYLSIDLSV